MKPQKYISVNSVAEEYDYISKQRCKCVMLPISQGVFKLEIGSLLT